MRDAKPKSTAERDGWLRYVAPEAARLERAVRRSLMFRIFTGFAITTVFCTFISGRLFGRFLIFAREVLPAWLPNWVGYTVIPLAWFAVNGGALSFVWLWALRMEARQLLRAGGRPTCMRCGYDCRGLERPGGGRPRCPECGAEI